MSVIASVAKATAGAMAITGTRPTRKPLPKTKRTLVVMVVALVALVAFAAMIPASQAPSTEHSSVGSKGHQVGAAVPISEPGAAPQMSEKEALDAYGKLPLAFVTNEGQTDKAVRYYAQGAGYGFFFTKEGAMLSFSEGKRRGGHALALDFLGADPHATLEPRQRLSGEANYLVGDDPANWQQTLPTYGGLLYKGLWPGIDMAMRGEGGKLKYEFHLKPGSSVEDVRLGYRGAKGLTVGDGGKLLLRTSLGVMKDAAPVSYQRIGGERVPVESSYRLTGGGGYGFAVGAYDPRYPLVIDPGLDYSTFLGGTEGGDGRSIAVDRDSRAYITGRTFSADYPTTPGAFDRTFNGGVNEGDAFVTKLNASGSALAYSTFLGGTISDEGRGIAVDRDGRAYVTGRTTSSDYPTTRGAFDRTFNGASDFFVTKLNASGSALAYSTFLGGRNSDTGDQGGGSGGIAVRDGRAYVTGITSSANFPTTPGAFDRTFNGGSFDAFATKLNASGSALAYSTLLGGSDFDQGFDVAVDGSGRAYVTGRTLSFNYPTTAGAFDTTKSAEEDAFVTKLNASGSALAYSTLLGGGDIDEGRGIAVDGSGGAYVAGITFFGNYPVTAGAFDTTFNGGIDAFVTKLNASGSALEYSTFLGGAGGELVGFFGFEVDGGGSAYVAGATSSTDYPTTADAYDTTYNGGFQDAFVTKLNASGSALEYSTFLGGTNQDAGSGIAVREGRAYVTGFTLSEDYPTTPGAFDTTYTGGFVTKLPTG